MKKEKTSKVLSKKELKELESKLPVIQEQTFMYCCMECGNEWEAETNNQTYCPNCLCGNVFYEETNK